MQTRHSTRGTVSGILSFWFFPFFFFITVLWGSVWLKYEQDKKQTPGARTDQVRLHTPAPANEHWVLILLLSVSKCLSCSFQMRKNSILQTKETHFSVLWYMFHVCDFHVRCLGNQLSSAIPNSSRKQTFHSCCVLLHVWPDSMQCSRVSLRSREGLYWIITKNIQNFPSWKEHEMVCCSYPSTLSVRPHAFAWVSWDVISRAVLETIP